MVVDHVGAYFFPDDLWFRAVGRSCVPLWLFLIGHARGREVPGALLLGALALTAANAAFALPLLALNALFTIAATRLVLDRVVRAFLKNTNRERMTIVLLSLVLLVPFTDPVAEYGTLGVLFAMMGALVRDGVRGAPLAAVAGTALVAFLAYEQVVFGFTPAQAALMAAGTATAVAALYRFAPQTLPAADARLPRAASWALRLAGRRTLEIYVAHLLLFKTLAWALSTGPFTRALPA